MFVTYTDTQLSFISLNNRLYYLRTAYLKLNSYIILNICCRNEIITESRPLQ
jgi:hypothetical protein